MREIGRKWGRIEHAQTAVEAEMIEAVWHGGFEPLRHIGLKNIAGEDALDDFADHPLIACPREIAGPAVERNRPSRGRKGGFPEFCLEPAPALDRAPLPRRFVDFGKGPLKG